MNKQEQLLIILYDLSQTISSEMKLYPLLRKLLQRLLYHTNYVCGLVLSKENSFGDNNYCLQVAIGDRHSQQYIGERFELSSALLGEETAGIAKLPVRQGVYQSTLLLPIPDYGLIILLGETLYNEPPPYAQMFAPILANLTKNIRLCQHSEAYTDSLKSDLLKAKDLAETTLNSIGDAVITTDSVGNVTGMNPVAENLTEWNIKNAIGKPLKTIFPIVDATTRESIENPVEKVLSAGKTVYLSNHTTLIAKSGKEYQIADSAAPIRSNEEIVGMVLVFNDVTEQYKLRESVLKSENQVRLLLNSTVEAIYGLDTQGNCTLVNHSCVQILGYESNDELLGKNMHDIIHHSHSDGAAYPREICPIFRAFQNGSKAHRDNEVFWRKDGSSFNVEYWSYPIFENEKCIGAVVSFWDVTKRKQTEEIMRRTQKMDALGKLTGGIAHDFNNMLGVILGYSELLKSQLENNPQLFKYINQIHLAGERGAKLTKRLLSFSRMDNTDSSTVNINRLLLDEQDMLQKTLTVQISLTFDLTPKIWPIWVDKSELDGAILNLSINAMHSMNGSDTSANLTIQTYNRSLNEADAKALGLTIGDYVLLSFTDSGCGMDTATKEQIFDPFFTTKGEHGTGLGLSQVFGFIKRIGGNIKVYSELGKGSQFDLYFPRYAKNTVNSSATVDSKIDFTGDENILVVDDEPSLSNLAFELLSDKGYNVFCAKDGLEAIKYLEQEDIDLVLSDVIMPGMNGYQLAEIVQKKFPSVKIQLVSGFSDEHNKAPMDSPVNQNLIYKPYNSDYLLKRIRELLNS